MMACIVAKKSVETNINVMPRIGLCAAVLDSFPMASVDGVGTSIPFHGDEAAESVDRLSSYSGIREIAVT